jgi:Flp pilus assembly protein TadD
LSLLQDALRRAQKGEGGNAPPAAGPLAGGSRKGLAARRRLWIGAGIATVFLVGAGAAILLVSLPREAAVKPPRPEASASASSAQAPPAPAASDSSRPAHDTPAPEPATDIAKPALPAPPPRTPRASARINTVAPRAARSAETPGGRKAPYTATEPARADGERIAHLARFNEGIAAQERGDWEAASALFREVVSKHPSVVEGWNGLGNALLRLGKLPEADRAFRKALSLDPNYAAALSNAGLLRLKDGRPSEAATYFARAAALEPRNPAPRVNLAISHARRGAVAEAEETLAAARRAFPSNPDVLYHLGTVYERAGDIEKAREAYTSFLAVSNGRQPVNERLVRERLQEYQGGSH